MSFRENKGWDKRGDHVPYSTANRDMNLQSNLPSTSPRKPPGRFRRPLLLALLLGSTLAAGCCGPRVTYPQPGFAGVPQAIHRSADFPLPLSDTARDELVEFMAAAGNRAVIEDEPPRRGQIRRIETEYGPVLDWLQRQVPVRNDLLEGSEFASLFDTAILPLVIHDARVGWDGHDFYDPGTDGIRALVRGDFVFAFYQRRVIPAPNASSTSRPDAWRLSPPAFDSASVYTGLVVFPRNFAIPTMAR